MVSLTSRPRSCVIRRDEASEGAKRARRQARREEAQLMVLVGIISDTHGRLTFGDEAALEGCDHIIHAGDIGSPSILDILEEVAPVTAVLGNNDWDEYGSAVGRVAQPVIEGVRFLVSHYPEAVRIGRLGSVIAPGDPIPRICVHGHTHVPEIIIGKQARPADYIICPGSVTYPRAGSMPSVAKVSIEAGRILEVRIEEVY